MRGIQGSDGGFPFCMTRLFCCRGECDANPDLAGETPDSGSHRRKGFAAFPEALIRGAELSGVNLGKSKLEAGNVPISRP